MLVGMGMYQARAQHPCADHSTQSPGISPDYTGL